MLRTYQVFVTTLFVVPWIPQEFRIAASQDQNMVLSALKRKNACIMRKMVRREIDAKKRFCT